ncbi:motility associated factor glycosyltransferase family protein [Aliagarivorans marinus]|uniref:motility associated factor glycosyltransferase family protein n=1 Tax=Aliagarivorans marinus TaxID=561965 RepID=UPI000411328B|nr:6-hydroxymethylpterin diphosphokinase MptE-like protein [Aliagarivorans marinus]
MEAVSSSKYSANLDALKEIAPELASRLAHRSHSFYKLKLTSANDFSIGDEAFYGGDGQKETLVQLQNFRRSPTHYSLSFKNTPNAQNLHQKVINQLNEAANRLGRKDGKPYASNLIALGCGMGYHLTQLSEEFSLKHIVLVEPSDAQLLALLELGDLHSLVASCKSNGGTVHILQPKSVPEFSRAMLDIFDHNGWGFLAEVTLYRHYNSELFDAVMGQFAEMRQGWLSAWGFFDDELIGLKHSVANAKKHVFRVNRNTVNLRTNLPVLIIGNGPSLDNELEYIKEKQRDFIIVSCGTAIAPLRKSGIQPDFHAEMERSLFTARVQAPWFEPSFAKNVTLLALNTVAQEITNLFPKAILFSKKNDVGKAVLSQACGVDLTDLSYCNPTVTNFAVGAIASLGFTNINLVGCDYGFKEDTHHHSRTSDYYDFKGPLKTVRYKSEIKVRGVDGNLIHSNRIFNQARLSMERLSRKLVGYQLSNCSAGASISGFRQRSLKSIDVPAITKAAELDSFLRQQPLATLDLDIERVLPMFNEMIRLSEALPLNNCMSICEHLVERLRQLRYSSEASAAWVLFSGSFKYLSVCIDGHLARLDKKHHAEFFEVAGQAISEMNTQANLRLKQIKENLGEI